MLFLSIFGKVILEIYFMSVVAKKKKNYHLSSWFMFLNMRKGIENNIMVYSNKFFKRNQESLPLLLKFN